MLNQEILAIYFVCSKVSAIQKAELYKESQTSYQSLYWTLEPHTPQRKKKFERKRFLLDCFSLQSDKWKHFANSLIQSNTLWSTGIMLEEELILVVLCLWPSIHILWEKKKLKTILDCFWFLLSSNNFEAVTNPKWKLPLLIVFIDTH